MKSITFKLPNETNQYDEIEIVPFSDLHIGDPHCEFKKILELIEYVKNKPNAYAILNGDLMNNALKDSVSDVYGEAYSPLGQIQKVVEIFKPIKDKIIGVVSGNHENRTAQRTSIDVSYMYALELGIADRYSREGLYVFLECGEESRGRRRNNKVRSITHRIAMMHGYGGGRSVGAKLNKLDNFSGVVDADLYILGHTHLPAVFKEDYLKADDHNRCLKQITRTYVNLNAMLSYGGYGEAFGFKPANTETPIIKLGNHKKYIKVVC